MVSLITIVSDNGLHPVRRQTIIWSNDDLSSITHQRSDFMTIYRNQSVSLSVLELFPLNFVLWNKALTLDPLPDIRLIMWTLGLCWSNKCRRRLGYVLQLIYHTDISRLGVYKREWATYLMLPNSNRSEVVYTVSIMIRCRLVFAYLHSAGYVVIVAVTLTDKMDSSFPFFAIIALLDLKM